MKQARITRRSAAAAAILGAVALAAATAPAALARRSHHRHHGVKVTVEVLGRPPAYKKIVGRTVWLTSGRISKDGGSCSAVSAAGALQLATKGRWSGTWDKEFGDYEVTKIEGTDLPFNSKSSANWYWGFWVNGKQAQAGVCGTHAERGETFLFKPACYGTACPRVGRRRRHRGKHARSGAVSRHHRRRR